MSEECFFCDVYYCVTMVVCIVVRLVFMSYSVMMSGFVLMFIIIFSVV